MSVNTTDNLNGLEKASLLLVAMGTSASAEVFRYLSEEEIEKLSAGIVSMRQVDDGVMKSVVAEFERAASADIAGSYSGRPQTPQSTTRRPFESLSRTEAGQIADLLAEEQPQVIALVLVSLPRSKAAAVLAEFDEETQAELALLICRMEEVDPVVIEAIEQSLKTRLAASLQKTSAKTGAHTLVEILNNASDTTGRAIMNALSQDEPSFAEQIRSRSFTFDDFHRLDSVSMKFVLREVDADDLTTALKAAEDDLRELVMQNLPDQAAQALRESLEAVGPVKVRDIEAAQQRIAGIARHLLAMNIISLPDTKEAAA